MMYTNTDGCASPLSPAEHDFTTGMVLPETALTHHNSPSAVDFPHNASSWELLDIVATSFVAADGADAYLVAVPSKTTEERYSTTSVKVAADTTATSEAALMNLPANLMAHQQAEACATAVFPSIPVAAAAVAAANGRAFLARGTSSEWSFVSTPKETHLLCGEATPTQNAVQPKPNDHTTTDALKDVESCQPDKLTSRVQLPASETGVPQASPTSFPLPSPVPLTHETTLALNNDSWSTTSYEEVCMSDALRSGGTTTRVASSVVSACTTPSPQHSATFNANGSASAHSSVTLNEQQEKATTAAETATRCSKYQADDDYVAAPSTAAPETSHLKSSQFKANDSSHDSGEQQADLSPLSPNTSKAALAPGTTINTTITRPARRLSFLSSSATTIAQPAIFTPQASLAGCTDVTSSLFSMCGDASLHNRLAPFSFSSFCFSFPFSVRASEAAQWCWTRTRFVCTDASQHTLRSLHKICRYVWMDLKLHWYPQLRLVLGDHSCAAQISRVRRARRRITHKKAEKNGAENESFPVSEASVDVSQWRSVSAPCFCNRELRISHRTTMHRATLSAEWRATGSEKNGTSGDHLASSMRHDLRRCFAVTADAVASAAQGLLVFFL